MANIHSTITYNANLSAAQAQIKALTTQIGTLTAAFNTLDKSALTAQRSLAATFAAGVGQTGGFTTSTVKATSAVETFGKQLAANRLTMRSYFREAINGYTRQNSLMRQLAAQQVRYQQSIAVPVGGGQAMMMTPQSINAASNAAALASQRFAVFNKLMDGGATAMLNWGKNTQWAGRQLMVGFTVPLMLFTAVASKQFRELDRELVRFQKVYGSDLGNAISDSTDRMREQVKQLAFDISRTYGIAAKDTAALAADIAATGREGEALISSVQQTTRLAVLGEVDRQEAMKATLSLQSAFRMNTNELAESINFLNAVENQTSATLEDLATAIPKVGPVVRSLGGDVKDLATLLVAMREGGIPAAEAANALKSGLSALINPTKQASDVAKQFGIDLVGIVEANKGQLMPTIYAMQEALSGLDSFGRSRVIEQIFGRYQFARITALFDNIGRVGSQTQSVVELASKSSAELAAVANQELRVLTESTAMRFQRTLEDLKNAIMPIGQTLTETLIPIFEFLGSGLKTVTSFFQTLPEPVKNFAKYGVAIAALAGPIIMMVGLFGNLIANGIKFGMMMTRLGARIAGIKIEKFELLNQDVMAAKLGVDGLTKSFDTQENALRRLTGVLSAYETSLRRLTTANPALFIPGALPAARSAMPIRRQAGSIGPEFVPGTGQGDKIPAMLEPGEFIVNRSATEKYAPVLMAMNRGNLPGFQEGGPTRLAHLTGSTRMPIQSILSQDVASPAARRVLQQMLADGINEVKLFNNLVIALRKSTNDSLNTEVEGRGVRKSILAAELQDRQRWSLMMKATGVSFEQLQPVINGITMSMNNLEGELINDPQLYRVVEQELIRLSNAGDQAAQRLLALSRQFGTFEYMRSDSNRPGRAALGVAASGVGTYKGSRLAAGSWSREFLLDMQNALDAEMSRTIQSSSPSRKSTEIGDKAGRNIGLGVLNGLQSGLTAATSGRRVSPIGPGMEATSPSARLTNAMQREINARTILEKALIKETQQTGLIADTKARMKTIQEKSNVSLANWTKSLEDGAWVHKNGTVAGKKRVVALEALAAEEMILKSQQEKLAAIVVLRQRAEENARISADNKAAADRTLTDANVRRAASSFGIGPGGSMGYFMTGTSPYATGTGKLSASAFDRKMADIAKMAGPTSSLSNRPAASTGPSVALGAARDQAQGGMRGIGAMNAVFALSMVTSSISMMGGASEEAAGKLSLFTTALMAASSLLMLRGMGGGMTSNFLGMGSLANQAGAANLRRSGMAGATAAQAGQLRALGYGKELGKLSGALSVLSGPVGIAAAAAVTGVAGAYLLVQNAADEARRRSVAAFEDPIKSAEYFGETVADVNQQMKDLNASMTEEQVEGIDQALRDAVKTDYADLIEKIRYGSATAGARELSLAFNKMIASGMSEENAVAAVKAIAIESGQAGGAAFAQAYTDGLLKAKTPQDVANNLAAQFDPELMTRNAEEIQKNIENFDLGPMADMAGNTAELLDNTFGDILLGVSSFASNINLSMQGLRFVKNFLPEGARDNAFVTAFDQLFNKDEAAATIDVAANYSRGMEQLMANLAENMDVSSTQIIGVVETLFSTFKEAPTESMAAFDKIAETALAFDNVEFDPVPIQDFLNTLDPLAAITLSPLIQDNEELALQIMKAVAAGMSLQEILEAIKDESLEIEINIKVRTQELEVALNELKTSYSDAVSGALGDDVEALDDRISNLTNRIEDLNKQKEKSLERMQEDFDAEQKMREDSVDGLQDELDQKRELFDEEMEALDERQQKVEEASDVYIKSLEKNQKADSFYAQQRKTALGALQKLASGDVFGFLQERQQMSADAQEFSYDQMISDIEERRDIEIDAIDEIREKRQKEQDEYEKNMEDKIDSIRDLMEVEQEAHEQAMADEEARFNTKIKNTKEELREKRTQREELQDIIDDAANGEITSAQELARRLPPEQAKQYIQKQKEIIKNIFLLEYAKELEEGGTADSAKARAARVATPLYSMLSGAKDQGALSADQLISELSISPTEMSGGIYYGTTTGGNTGGRGTTTTSSFNPSTTWGNGAFGEVRAGPDGISYSWDGSRWTPVIQRANGGKVTGPGGPKSDVIPAMLSNGEYVIQASSVNKYGKDMMDHINAGKFAGGGPISTSRAAADANATFRGSLPTPIMRAEGGPVEMKKSFQKWIPENKLSFYNSWDSYGNWPGGKPSGIMMHHTAGVGPGVLQWMARHPEAGKPVVQAMIGRDATAHILAYGGTGWGAGEGGTSQLTDPKFAGLKEDLQNLGSASNILWQVEVESAGKVKDFTSNMFDTIARMSAAVREYSGWNTFAGKIINHATWAPGRKNDTLYPIGLFEQNANNIWGEGGKNSAADSKGKGSGKNNNGRKEGTIEGGPSSIAPQRGLFGILSMLEKSGESSNDSRGSGKGRGKNGGRGNNNTGGNPPTVPGISNVLSLATKYAGLPYSSSYPIPVDAKGNPTGWGCATSVAWLYKNGAGISLPSPSLSYGQYAGLRQSVSRQNIAPGDLIFYKNDGPSGVNKQNPVNHVEMYMGSGRVFNGGVGIQSGFSNHPVIGIKRPAKFASGGFIAGPGGPRSDMIPAMLSNGEYVVKASSVAKYGKGFMDQINAGQFGAGGMAMAKPMSMAPRGYADGGFVGSVPMATPTFGMPQMASVSPADISANVSNSFGGDSNSATVNSSKVNVIINASGGKSAKAIANRVISIINEANGRRNHSRSI